MFEIMCDHEAPLISCVMVTTGRTHLLKSAVLSFNNQIYSRKELVILSQGTPKENAEIRSIIEPFEGIHFVEAPKRLSLGEMRNVSVELAQGDVVCQWDDDDFYHPERVLAQFKAMTTGKAVASLYTQHLKYFADTGEMYLVDYLRGTPDCLRLLEQNPYKKYLCGSVMFLKSCFYKAGNRLYPERGAQSDREEDLNVLQRLIKMGGVAPVNIAYHYCYVYHGTNVYERRHHEFVLHKKHLATADELRICETGIRQTLHESGVEQTVKVCTSPFLDFHQPDTSLVGEVVFTYTPNHGHP